MASASAARYCASRSAVMLARVIVPAPPWMTSMIFPFASAASEGSANTIVAVHRKRRMNMARKLSLFIFAFVTLDVSAQKPDADWRTIETAHFRVHYPREYEQWS